MNEVSFMLTIVIFAFNLFFIWYGRGDKKIKERILELYLTQDMKEDEFIRFKDFIELGDNENVKNKVALKNYYRSYNLLIVGKIISGILTIFMVLFGIICTLNGQLNNIFSQSTKTVPKEVVLFALSFCALVILSLIIRISRNGMLTETDDLFKETQHIRIKMGNKS